MRAKILTILLCAIVLFVALDFAVYRLILYQSYLSLEEEEAGEDLSRCLGALQREIDHLDSLVYDWAAWDDTYRFVQDRNEAYISSNLPVETFTGNELNLIYIFDTEGEVVWGEFRLPGTYERAGMEEFSSPEPETSSGFFEADAPGESVSGVWITSESPMIVASRPIMTSDDRGPITGYLIMGRVLTEEYMAALSEQTRVSHTYELFQDLPPEALSPEDLGRLAEGGGFCFDPVSSRSLRGYTVFPDISGRPGLLLRADLDRSVTLQGKSAIWSAIISVSLVGGVLLAVTLLILHHRVIRPLSDLTEKVVTCDGRNELSCGALSDRRDEIGLLCREFMELLFQVQAVNRNCRKTNILLSQEVRKQRKTEGELQVHQERLRALSSELAKIEDRERRRLAVELHDRIGQSLAVLRIQIEMALGGETCLPESAADIKALLDGIIHDSRSLTFELSPPVLYELGLGPAVEWLAEEIMQREKIRIEVEDGIEFAVEEGLRAMLFRSVRELLHNVVKHAGADRARVRMSRSGGEFRVIVEDNGKGFDPEEKAGGLKKGAGFGLFSIQERIRQLGGGFDVRPGETGGSVVILTLPMSPDGTGEDVGGKI